MTLEEYSKELNLYNTMSLDMLIESHRFLRKEYIKKRDEILKEISDTRTNAHKEAFEYALKENFVSREDLEKMTIHNFANFIIKEINHD